MARGPNNGEEADLKVEDADQEEDEADADGEEEEHHRHRVPTAAGAGTRRRTSAPVTEPTTSRRSPPPPRTTTHRRSLTREVEEQAPSGRRREWEPVYKGRRNRRHFASRGGGQSGSGEWGRTRRSFPFPPEPVRATPPPPKIALRAPPRARLQRNEGFGRFQRARWRGRVLLCEARLACGPSTTNMATCSPRAQPGLRARVANTPLVSVGDTNRD